jgi:hypothetical protein
MAMVEAVGLSPGKNKNGGNGWLRIRNNQEEGRRRRGKKEEAK